MATGPGYLDTKGGLADQLAGGLQLRDPGQNNDALGYNTQWQAETLLLEPKAIAGSGQDVPFTIPTKSAEGALALDQGVSWWEYIHLVPRSIDFGQILTTTTIEIELFNAFRKVGQQLNSVLNNVGEGLTITDLPALPYTVERLKSLVLTLEASTIGAPRFDSTIDFQFAIYVIQLLVEGQRVVVFPFIPEVPLVERLEFLTDVLERENGTEQRVNLRHSPRQTFDIRLVREDKIERNRIEFLLYDWQHRAFGVPVWYEGTALTADVTSGATTVNVESTAYADYRVGGLAIIVKDDTVFDSLIVDSITATSITFVSTVLNNYPAGTRVYPLRVCLAEPVIDSRRYRTGAAEFSVRMRSTENIANIGSTAAFDSYSGKVLVDDANFQDETGLPQRLIRKVVAFDNETGRFGHLSNWDWTKRGTAKGWVVSGSRQQLWEIRQLLYALKGRLTSFWLPTKHDEFEVLSTLLNGTTALVIRNTGYARYVQSRDSKNVIRLTKTNGTQYINTITNGVEDSITQETLTVQTSWTENIPVADIERIEFFELVRFDTDEIRIDHLSGVGDAQMFIPVVTVFD